MTSIYCLLTEERRGGSRGYGLVRSGIKGSGVVEDGHEARRGHAPEDNIIVKAEITTVPGLDTSGRSS